MAQSSRPSSGQHIDRTQPTAPSRPGQQDEHQANSSPAGFGTLELVELATNPIIEGILGSNKDGRVRNPTPAKLKGKTDNKLGNFGVMQMGMSPPGKKNDPPGKEAAAERDAAARRTSENTASRAKAAQQEKYVPPKRRGIEAAEAQPNRRSPFVPGREDQRQRARPLAPDETKFEQARLLTLLRSINPVTIVDQICKAVAYFGGIPGAPPPEDGIFPESANTGETGALFIGWLAEIFPNLSSPEAPRIQDPSAIKTNKGRGAKSMPVTEPPNPKNGFGFGQAISAPAWGLPQSLSLVNTVGTTTSPDTGRVTIAGQEQQTAEQLQPSTPIKQPLEDAPHRSTASSKRGRGRPKGSRNKGKNDTRASDTTGSGNNDMGSHGQVVAEEQSHKSPKVLVQIPGSVEKQAQSGSSTYVPQAAAQTTGHKAQNLQYPEQTWQINSGKNQIGPPAPIAPMDELSPEERAVLEAFRQPPLPQASSITQNSASAKGPPAGGAKRKRAPPKPKTNIAAPTKPTADPPQGVQAVNNIQIPDEAGSSILKDPLQWGAVDTATPTGPPAAKRPRQRKAKAPSINDPPSRNQTASLVGTPPIASSTIPDSTASSSQQSIPPSRPPAEGLEAHYERFASIPQQNGRSHTPSITPQQLTPQQQLRQQQKPPSVPPTSQQPTAQQQQTNMQQQKSQQGMQQQKSQQGLQREDQKMSQGTSVRPPSTGYYNQRNQGPTYNQYPSQQPSQLYGSHQASPQMSTNNSYRTNTTHTLAHASPQFSQADSTYRTATPHTISQPSPSYTQSDNTFRTSSTHTLAQPSPTYSQPEPTYRTASTHSVTQPSPAYSRPHTQNQTSHQSHYNHFPDNAYVDLPTLESLGHGGTSTSTGVGMGNGPYGQNLGVSLGNTAASRPGSNSLYGTASGMNNTFDTSATDLLRGVSRSAASNSTYGTSSGLSHAFDTSEQGMRERLMKNIGNYNRR